jgi:glycosyltransferase involved in cell wall biosynthesis
VAGRISKFYRKSAVVVYPPIENRNKEIGTRNKKKGNYYLLATRVTGAKGVLETVNAAREGGFKLKLVGEVVEKRIVKKIEKMGMKNIEMLGRVSDSDLAELYERAKGFIALARDEDFGMTVVESMMAGTPVLALNAGGYKETVMPGLSGILIDSADSLAVARGIEQMGKVKWDSEKIKKWGSKFSRSRFEKEVEEIIHA